MPGGMAPGFSSQFCDVEVDPETGKVTILQFVAAQDVGCAIHPSYVEGRRRAVWRKVVDGNPLVDLAILVDPPRNLRLAMKGGRHLQG